MSITHTWDFFIAHAGPDTEIAERLYARLNEHAPTFLDVRSLPLGSDWDTELTSAQASSRITLVLVSVRTPRAYYQREEIARATTLARDAPSSHTLIPIFLDPESVASEGVPYGLRLKHGIVITPGVTIDDVAERLLAMSSGPSKSGGHRSDTHPDVQGAKEDALDPWAGNPNGILHQILTAEDDVRTGSALFHWKLAVLFARLRRLTEANEALHHGDCLGSTADPRRRLYAGFVYFRSAQYEEGEAVIRELLQRNDTPNRDAAIAFD